MPLPVILVLAAAVSYLLGAIPFSLIIARCHGVDVRKVGSGNVGATNVLRSVGKLAGISALLLDMAKGFLPTLFLPLLAETFSAGTPDSLVRIICAVCAICGHVWPVYLKFKGGKGIATSAGALIALAPAAVLIGLMVWVIIFTLTRYVSLASIIAAFTIPILGWYLYTPGGTLLPCTLTAIGALAVIRHHSNIRRLLQGKESRISFSKKTPKVEKMDA
jgi:glycerol-3-phosphate acyltransferase PlsY